jgi:uncharacterized protein Yka (UPF0111/DUF47 family)
MYKKPIAQIAAATDDLKSLLEQLGQVDQTDSIRSEINELESALDDLDSALITLRSL